MPFSTEKPRFLSMALFTFCFGFIIFSAVFALNAEESKRALRVDDQFKLKRVGAPQVSPEVKWMAYTITETDLEKDKSETRLWMVPVSGGGCHPNDNQGFLRVHAKMES